MKRIQLNGFKMATVGHTAVGLWRHPENQAYRYKDLSYWVETARTLEAGGFDSLFIADSLGIFDVYEGKPDVALRHGIHTPVSDPLMMVSAMAAVTKHLGFVVTVSTSYEQPYSLARKMTTLDHLTRGRIGWNVVTSALDSAARNLGLGKLTDHDERYAIADEFMDVVYKLWEGSWEDDAVVNDRIGGTFVDPAKVHAVRHFGKHYQVPDAYICEPSVQRTPVIFQAGASSEGKKFAAKHAEGIFANETRAGALRTLIGDIRAQAEAAGRDPSDVKFFSGATIVVGETDKDAQRRYEALQSFLSEEATLARYSSLLQLDFSKVDLDAPLEHVETQGIRTALERFTKNDSQRRWTPREIARKLASSLGGLCIVGSPATVADQMEQWIEDTGADGFNVGDYMPLQTFREFNQLVAPELRKRGRLWDRYEGSTLRESMYGPGHTRVRPGHPASNFSRGRPSRAGVVDPASAA